MNGQSASPSVRNRFWTGLAVVTGLALAGLGLAGVGWWAGEDTLPANAAGMPVMESFRLDNGMDVIVIPDHRVPVVTHMVWYRVGAADEPPGKSGLAHFLEHLMFKGTDEIAPGEFSKTIARQGGQDNAFTGQDYTAYFQRIARDRLPLVMAMEADRMSNLKLAVRDVVTERDVVLEERRGRLTDRPLGLLGEKMQVALYGDHPYAVPVIGLEPETAKLTREDALSFYKAFYAPDNAALIIAGDITVDEARDLAVHHYGGIPAHGHIPPRHRTTIKELSEPVRVIHQDARVRQPSLQRIYLADSYKSAGLPRATAVDMLVDILGGGTSARLYKSLVVDKALAVDAGAWAVTEVEDRGRIGIYATPRPGVSLEQLEAALDDEINRMWMEGVTVEEVERSRRRLVAQQVYARDKQQDMAHMYGISWATGTTPEQVLAWLDVARALPVAAVNEAGRLYLGPHQGVTGWLVPGDEENLSLFTPEARLEAES